MKTITVIVAKDGSSQVETKGFTGSSCQAASKFIEEALGARQSEKLTAEYFSQQTSSQQIQEGQA
jgi:hypothetical protein